MLRSAGIEAVRGEHFCALQQPKARLVDDQMQVAALAADRAVAVLDGDARRRAHLVADGAAVAAAAAADFYRRPPGQKPAAPPAASRPKTPREPQPPNGPFR